MSSSALRRCPQCFGTWPKSADHDLRGFKWLDPLPRNISVNNADLLIHDGHHGRDRFLLVEVKMRWEQALQAGQHWVLRALAQQEGWTVRLLHDGTHGTSLHTVGRDGVEASGTIIERSAFRASVVDWLNGQPWADRRGISREHGHPGSGAHVCGWQLVEGQWCCVQDFYAVGFAPETGCGSTWEYVA